MRGQKSAPTQLELYASTNGMLSIRAPHANDPAKYSSHETGTSVIASARKVLARYLSKNGIKDVKVSEVPINSMIGVIPDNVGSVASYIREKRGIVRPPQHKANGADRTVTATAIMKGRKVEIEDLRALVQIIATAHASAATALRLLQERLGEPTYDT